MESLIRTLSTSLIDLYNNQLIDYIETSLNSLKNIQSTDLIENINLLKIKFEILLFLSEKIPLSPIINNIDDIISNNRKSVKNLLSEFNEDENIQESIHFKKLIKNI